MREYNMKHNLLHIISSLLFGVLLICCTQEDDEANNGSLNLNLSTDYSITTETKAQTKAQTEGPTANDFVIAVYDEDGSNVIRKWETVASMPDAPQLPAASYLLKASYGTQHTGAFETPYYEGATPFVITRRNTTNVQVVCRIANTKLTLEYSDGFKEYFKDWTAKAASTGDSLTIGKDEIRAAFFEPGQIGLKLTMTRQNGKTLEYEPPVIHTEGGKHYRVRLDVTSGGVGGVNLVIRFDKETEEKPIYVDISGDSPIIVAAPFITSVGFSNGVPVAVAEGASAGKIYTLINARGKIKSCILRTQSSVLKEQGWPETIDLANAEADVSKLKGITFTKGIKGTQMAEIDFTNLIPLLPASSQTSLSHTFSIEVTDEAGHKNEEFALVMQMTVPGFKLLKLDNVMLPEDSPSAEGTAEVRFEMTSGDPAKIKAQAKDDYGIWSDWEWVSGKEPKLTNVTNVYVGTIRVKVENKKEIRLNYNNGARISNSGYLYGGKYVFELMMQDGGEANANNPYVWATKAYIKIKDDKVNPYKLLFKKNDEDGENLELEVLKDNVILLKGLDAGADNNIIVKVIEAQSEPVCKPFKITTEEEKQLPNAGFDLWTTIYTINDVSIGGKRAYFYYDWLSKLQNKSGDPFKKTLENKAPTNWSNLNLTSMPQNATNKNTWYIIPSCLPGQYSGTCAWIRNVSWDAAGKIVDSNIPGDGGFLGLSPVKGTPNTANSVISSKSIGKLFLGETQDGSNLSSRPTAMTGMFKYLPKGDEKGKVTIVIKNGVTEIAKGEYVFTDSDFSTFRVNLNYSNLLLKAERIFVTFVATYNKAESEIKTDFNTTYANSKFDSQDTNDVEMTSTGSELYIDDLKLIYE